MFKENRFFYLQHHNVSKKSGKVSPIQKNVVPLRAITKFEQVEYYMSLLSIVEAQPNL